MFAAGLVALLIAICVAVLVERMDDSVRTAAQLTSASGLPTLGTISRTGDELWTMDEMNSRSKPSALSLNSRKGAFSPEPEFAQAKNRRGRTEGEASEAFRILRTNLEFALVDKSSRTLLITSPGPHEGKSTV